MAHSVAPGRVISVEAKYLVMGDELCSESGSIEALVYQVDWDHDRHTITVNAKWEYPAWSKLWIWESF